MVDAGAREQAYWALRASLLSRPDRIDAFDAVFAAFWDAAEPAIRDGAGTPPEPDGAPPLDSEEGEEAIAPAPQAEDLGAGSDAGGRRWSAEERLRAADFASYGTDELARARRLILRLARALPRRRARRLRPTATGRRLDRRASLRSAMRTEGHPLELLWREPVLAPRKLLMVIDVSGSMEPYARPLLIFAQALRQASPRVEVFAFGTRLTRLTRELAGRDAERALRLATMAVPDWAGGTRIGDNLATLNRLWGRRGLIRGAVVVVLSDGWERGDAATLAAEMKRLRRSAHRVIWVNPLAGEPGYEPLAAGMAAALPHVDDFLPGQNLRDLEGLAAALSELPATRGGKNPRSGGRNPRTAWRPGTAAAEHIK